MTKLLLILLCLPMIGFGQNSGDIYFKNKQLIIEGLIDNKYDFTIKISKDSEIPSYYSEFLMSSLYGNNAYNGFYFYKNPKNKIPITLFESIGMNDMSFWAYSFYEKYIENKVVKDFKEGFQNGPKQEWEFPLRNAKMERDYFKNLNLYDERFDFFSENIWTKESKKLELKIVRINSQSVINKNSNEIKQIIFEELRLPQAHLIINKDTFLIKNQLFEYPRIVWMNSSSTLLFIRNDSPSQNQNSFCGSAATKAYSINLLCLKYDENTKTYYTLNDIEVYNCSSDGPISYGDKRAEFKIEETDNFITTTVIPESRELRNKKRTYKYFKDTGAFYELDKDEG